MEKISLKAKIVIRDAEVLLDLKTWQVKWLAEYVEKDLSIEIKPWSDKRTLKQNALMWALISEVDLKENGRASNDGEMTIYKHLIKLSKIKTFDYEMTVDAFEETKRRKIFRVVDGFDLGDGMMFVRCYPGTSNFDKKEMNDFIESLLDYAEQVGVNTDPYVDLK